MTSIRTIADRRVVAEQGVVLNQYVGPLNWEHYKIPASGLSNSQITFANLVTLGTNRIYDSGFQIEYTIELTFASGGGQSYQVLNEEQMRSHLRMHPFPLHWVTDQLRVNINGAACMVRPQESLPQRMMYWRQRVIDKTCNFCPHTKTPLVMDAPVNFDPASPVSQGVLNFQMKYGRNGSQNFGTPLDCVSFHYDTTANKVTITIREPVLCSPFNQSLDEIYQAPLFDVTSIDMVYQLNDLKQMFETSWYTDVTASTFATASGDYEPKNYIVNITSANLCFNVASMPAGMTVPSMLQLPYYDNVCYVTNGNVVAGTTGEVSMTSGVYTLAQVPTAIYIFVSENQLYRSGASNSPYETSLCPIRNINITMGNNTQLLNTTTEYDRYQMALANGLEDVTWEEFINPYMALPNTDMTRVRDWDQGQKGNKCILRLVPGIDLLIPDKRLVGGMDAEQMVFQVRLTADVTGTPDIAQPYLSLWIMFEYCGVLTIEPVHASIDMIPIKSMPPIGKLDGVAYSNVDLATGGGEGTNPTGAGIWDLIKSGYKLVKGAWNSSIGKKLRHVADSILDPRTKVTMEDYYTPPQTAPSYPALPPPPRNKVKIEEVGGTIIGGDTLGKFYA